MRRRDFIKVIAGSTVAWPLAAHAQRPPKPVIGFINAAPAQSYETQLAAFHKGLDETGYVDGRNVTIEYRWADGHYDRLPALAADLVRRQVTVVAATTTPAAVVAKAATGTIPIVFTTTGDPVELHLVTSLNRPGGNATGVTQMNVEVAPKRLELLHELVPAASVVALLVNPTNPNTETNTEELQVAARTLGLELHVLNASSERDFDAVFAKLIQLRAGGLVIGADTLFASRIEQLAALAFRHMVPTIYQSRDFAVAGGLLSYGTDYRETYRLAGNYIGRVLKGEKAADLPVQQASKVEFYINLKTAKALGLNVPATMQARVDEMIE